MLQKNKATLILFAAIAMICCLVAGLFAFAACSDGADGADGKDGADGRGISSATINSDGYLVLTYTDNTSDTVGLVVGADGATGATGATGEAGANGVGITNVYIDSDGYLVVELSDGNAFTSSVSIIGADGATGETGATGATGAQGEAGADGVGVSSIYVDDDGNVWVVYTNSTTAVNVGSVDVNVSCDCAAIESIVYNADGSWTVTMTDGTTSSVATSYAHDHTDANTYTYTLQGAGVTEGWTCDDPSITLTLCTDNCGYCVHTYTASSAHVSDGVPVYEYIKVELDVNGEEVLDNDGNVIPVLDTYGNYIAASCYTNGTAAAGGTCIYCGSLLDADLNIVEEGNVETPGHQASGTWTLAYEDGTTICEDGGVMVQLCTVCDTVLDSFNVAATGHNITWEVVTAPTTESEGTLGGTCSTCGKYIEVTIGALTQENAQVEFDLSGNIVYDLTVDYDGLTLDDAEAWITKDATINVPDYYVVVDTSERISCENASSSSGEWTVYIDGQSFTFTATLYGLGHVITLTNHDTGEVTGYEYWDSTKIYNMTDYYPDLKIVYNTNISCADDNTVSRAYFFCASCGGLVYVMGKYEHTFDYDQNFANAIGSFTYSNTFAMTYTKDGVDYEYTYDYSAVVTPAVLDLTDADDLAYFTANGGTEINGVTYAYVAPTCTETGYYAITCSVCGGTYEVTLDATGHTYAVDSSNPLTVNTDATKFVYTSETGKQTVVKIEYAVTSAYLNQTCTVCGDATSESIDTSSIRSNKVDPTCNTTGTLTYSYTVGGTTYYADPIELGYSYEHSLSVGSGVTVPEYACVLDDNLAYTYDTDGNVAMEQTIIYLDSNGGAYYYKNNVQGDAYKVTIYEGAISGFTGVLVAVNSASYACNEATYGDGYFFCDYCTKTNNTTNHNDNGAVYVPVKTPHTYDAGTVTTAATCTTNGEMTYTCTVCNTTFTEVIAATGHALQELNVYDTTLTDAYLAATHSTNGYQWYICTNANCDYSYTSASVYETTDSEGTAVSVNYYGTDGVGTYTVMYTLAALGHVYTYEVTLEPTETEVGYVAITCASCVITWIAEIPALDESVYTVAQYTTGDCDKVGYDTWSITITPNGFNWWYSTDTTTVYTEWNEDATPWSYTYSTSIEGDRIPHSFEYVEDGEYLVYEGTTLYRWITYYNATYSNGTASNFKNSGTYVYYEAYYCENCCKYVIQYSADVTTLVTSGAIDPDTLFPTLEYDQAIVDNIYYDKDNGVFVTDTTSGS